MIDAPKISRKDVYKMQDSYDKETATPLDKILARIITGANIIQQIQEDEAIRDIVNKGLIDNDLIDEAIENFDAFILAIPMLMMQGMLGSLGDDEE